MTYVRFVEFIVDFALIQVIESSFIVIMVMLLSKIKLDWYKVVTTILICSIFGSIILPFGNYDIINRFEYLTILGLAICAINRCDAKRALKVVLNIFIVLTIMMFAEFVGFIPLLFFLGEKISTIHDNLFLALVLTIPTRVFEYLICHLTYTRFGGKHEEINRNN
jgi:hypothetical protein